MNTNAATHADSGSASDSAPRWSSADDLLVWTVSRIDGGRRHGVERDCHVVYGLSRGYFVEQTRKFRASAEQCIEMLQQGKRAGTTQRKIALDTIVAIRSDARSGRLQIRTLNGTHQLDPVSLDEADVLRQIAIELELRMPPGGAEFLPMGDSHGVSFGRDRIAEERRALVSLENARTEDVPDTQQEPDYQHQPVDTSGDFVAEVDEPAVAQGNVHPGHFTEEELERLSATLEIETDPVESDVIEHHDQGLPGDITVAGGVEIIYEPATAAEPAQPVPETDRAFPVQESSPGIAESSEEAVPWVATPETGDDSPIYLSQQTDQHEEAESGVAAAQPEQGRVGDFSNRFGRLHNKALRHQIESGTPLPEPVAEPDYEPINRDSGPVPSTVFVAPTPPNDDPGAEEPSAAVASESLIHPQPQEATPIDERRQSDDPSFPSIFDRRGAGPAPQPQSHAQFGDDLPVDHTVSHHVPPLTVGAATEDDSEDSESDLPAAPPTISAPSGPPVAGMGGSVGFNPDFDVNPFR